MKLIKIINRQSLDYTPVNDDVSINMEYDLIGNILYKSDIVPSSNDKYHYDGIRPHAVSSITNYISPLERIQQDISYTSFDKVSSINQNDKELLLTYGIHKQRIKQEIFDNDQLVQSKYYLADYEEIQEPSGLKKVHYISSPTGMALIYTQKTDTNELLYVHKDHLGSIQYLSDGNGDVKEAFSYDPWGKRRDANTWLAYSELPENLTTSRGFTGHEHLDLFELVNMNGRIYDPITGRFLSADPYIQSPDNSQGLNRYSYAWNNPLVMVDPSGYNNAALIIGAMVGIAISIVTFGAATPVVGLFFAAMAAGLAGGIAGGIAATLLSGGNFNDALYAGVRGGVIGGLTAVVSFGIGIAFDGIRKGAQVLIEIGRAAAHASFNGAMRVIQGGKFIHGFISGFISSLGGSAIASEDLSLFSHALFGAVLGGTASMLSGGKFANGAITGAFVVLFNHYVGQLMARPTATDGGYVRTRGFAAKFCMKMSEDAGVEVSYVVSVDSNGEELYFVEPWDQNSPKVSYNRSISGDPITKRYEEYQKLDPETVMLHGNRVTEQHHFGYDISGNQITTGSFKDAMFSYKYSIKVYHYSTEGYYYFNVKSTNALNFIEAANYSGGFTEKTYPY